uniref:NADH-ubiquinone oxidoreductase chain 3 n=1 Tax=Pyrhila pisum TaxID=1550678 RepID=A0A165TXB0_PYRPS|nr:NADH dehydrogenase subunit 3 [Pyrhila pisum]AMY96226.1 NADH dehydrogenase subunit 3 [Pyrhila pisum]
MYLLFIFTLLTMTLSLLIMIIASLISKKTVLDREKNSPYECGFDPKSSARIPFSLSFFIFAVVFLIFDVEITLLLPMATVMNLSNIFSSIYVSIMFLIILLLGLFYEWAQGALEWSK